LYRQGLNLVIELLRGVNPCDFRADASTLEKIAGMPRLDEEIVSIHPQPHKEGGVTELEKAQRLEELRIEVLRCTKCGHLAASRHSVVFGVGSPQAKLMFIGEAPGADEDLQGEPFVGRAGELLTKIIQAMGFQRPEVFIANILKCRPDMPAETSGNRPPTPLEIETCIPYLRQQIELIEPKVMVALGTSAMRGLFGKGEPISQTRGHWHSFGSIPVMATFHPSYLLRNQALNVKRMLWEDMLQVLERLGHPITEKQQKFFLTK
jgi:uracil-DNA glycosylase family 4